MTVLISGGGIAGLTMGLTLHQIGVPFHTFEIVKSPKPLGVGTNLQPTAVRELMELDLDQVGIRTQDYGFYTKTGVEIWTEPRGIDAGYNWPQYSVHRGQLYMALLDTVGEDTNVFVISHKGDQLFDKFRSVIKFEKKNNFSRIAK